MRCHHCISKQPFLGGMYIFVTGPESVYPQGCYYVCFICGTIYNEVMVSHHDTPNVWHEACEEVAKIGTVDELVKALDIDDRCIQPWMRKSWMEGEVLK